MLMKISTWLCLEIIIQEEVTAYILIMDRLRGGGGGEGFLKFLENL